MIYRIQRFYLLSFLVFIISLSSCETPLTVSEWDVVDANSVLIMETEVAPNIDSSSYTAAFFQKSNVYLSCLQPSSKNDFHILYSYRLSKNAYDSLLISKEWGGNNRLSNRQFNGFEIHEIKNDHSEAQFTFCYLKGIFVLSRSSLLIENAIRVFQNQESKNFKINNRHLFQFPLLKSDQGNLYLNINNLSEIYSESPLLKEIPILNEIKNLSVYDIKSSDYAFSLNGFSIGNNSSLSIFQKQRPVAFKVAKYIPNAANGLVHFGVTDFRHFNNVTDSSFINKIPIGNEIAFMSLGGALAAFIELKSEPSEDFSFLTGYSETYSNYQIRSVDGEVLKKGFGKIFPDARFDFCFIRDNYLVLAHSVEELKILIDAVENEDTWGKTSEYQKFIVNGLQESNITIILKNPDLFSGTGILKKYSSFLDSVGLTRIHWMSLQTSALDNHFYSNINLTLDRPSVSSVKSKKNSVSSFITLPTATRFAVLVKNHTTGLQDILIQDSDLFIYLISLNDGIIWKRQLDGPIQELYQLDFYKNGKLQYFFSIGNRLYIIDRLGRDVAGFPKTLPAVTKFFGLVDYDKSKNYRYLVSTEDQRVYLYDKDVKNLSDWGPKKFGNIIVNPPSHFKVGGKDFFIVFLSDGAAQVFNRKGDRIDFFYIKDKTLFSGDYYLESGMSSSTTYLNYLSKEGVVFKQNLKGEILKSDNLLRGKNSKFILRTTLNSDKYYFYRTDTDKIIVFDKAGGIVFEKQNNGSMNLEFQCIETGNGKFIFCFYDTEQRLVQVFDESGNDLIQAPLESDIAPVFGYGKSKSEFGIFSFQDNSVTFNLLQ